MKKQSILSCLFIFFFIFSYSQQIQGIQRGQRGYVPPPKWSDKTFIELRDPIEDTQKIVKRCTDEFGLDDFQREILKSMVYDNIEAENAILSDKGNTRETRKQKIIALNNQFYSDLSNILTIEQINQYKVMDFDRNSEEKEKKKKKRKKKRKNKEKTDS